MKTSNNAEKEISNISAVLGMKFLFTISAIFILQSTSFAQNWVNVGSAGFSAGTTNYTCLVIAPGGIPYISYSDIDNGSFATVMEFNGTNWDTVGSPAFSNGYTSFNSMAIDSAGTPYVVYQDGYTADNMATVMKFNGTGWVNVGTSGFTPGQASYTSIAIDTGGTPYVLFQDGSSSLKATVMKYTDSAGWIIVGSPGFSAGEAAYTNIVIDNTGTVYAVYEDYGNGNRATVMKFNGSGWETLGSAGFSAGQALYTSIAIGSNDTPYVAYQDGGNGTKITVMKYNGTNWVTVGSAGFSDTIASYVSIAIDSNGAPLVAYMDGSTTLGYGPATVKKYNGTGWATLGISEFSAGFVWYTSIAVSGITPYVGYVDCANSYKATVMKYIFPTDVKNINSASGSLTVFPDPNSGSFTLNISSPEITEAKITITGMLGDKIKQIVTTTNTDTQMQLDTPPGIYFISAVTQNGSITRKIVIE